MINELIEQMVQSGPGAALVKEVQATGLSPDAAKAALTATAEGALQHGGGEGGLAALAQGLLGGSGSGGLAAMAGGLLGGASAPEASPLSSLVPTIAEFVATKTGLDPAMAQTVVSLALPKVLELIRNHTQGAASVSPVGSALKGLFS